MTSPYCVELIYHVPHQEALEAAQDAFEDEEGCEVGDNEYEPLIILPEGSGSLFGLVVHSTSHVSAMDYAQRSVAVYLPDDPPVAIKVQHIEDAFGLALASSHEIHTP